MTGGGGGAQNSADMSTTNRFFFIGAFPNAYLYQYLTDERSTLSLGAVPSLEEGSDLIITDIFLFALQHNALILIINKNIYQLFIITYL